MNKFKPNKPLLKDLKVNKQKIKKLYNLNKSGSVSGLTAISSVQHLNADMHYIKDPREQTVSPSDRFPVHTVSPSYSRERIISEQFVEMKKTLKNEKSDKSILAMNNDPRLQEMLLSNNKEQK